MVGTYLGQYRVTRLLGAGGMGEVYLAQDSELERTVALKVLHGAAATAGARQRLLGEARAASVLNHPNICTIYGIGEVDNQAFIVMEHVQGRPLAELLRAGPLPLESILHYGIQVADALAHAHRHGDIHRDLKSANLMITDEGRVKVLDFGLAQRSSQVELSRTIGSMPTLESGSKFAGTIWYLAPEILQGEGADEQSDVWALGAVLYEMASGELPFQGGTAFEVSSQILREPPRPLPPGLPPALGTIILHCLAKDRSQRYRAASEVRAALEAGGSQASFSMPLPVPTRRRRWRALTVPAALALAGLAVAALLAPDVRRALRPGGGPKEIRRLAVLPLENRGGQAEPAYLIEGMTDALIAELANIEGLRVIARDSVMRLRDGQMSRQEVAERLEVDAVVAGSLLREGDRIRITAELIEGRTGNYLWADSFDDGGSEILRLQGEVAEAIARQLRGDLTREESARLLGGGTASPAAYEAYLRGRYHWNRRSAADFHRAIEYFEVALEHDPAYALAHAGIADAHVLLGIYGYADPVSALPAARAAAERALELDDSLAEAHTTLAAVAESFEWDWAGAEAEYRRAIELNPSYATAAHWYGMFMMMMGRLDESLRQLEAAAALDPLSPPIQTSRAMALVHARRPDAAIEQAESVLELEPDFAWAHNVLAQAHLQRGSHDPAVEHARRASELADFSPEYQADLAAAYAAAGHQSEADAALAAAEQPSGGLPVPWFEVALAYVQLGETDRALDCLEQAYVTRSAWMPYLEVETRLDPLRADPRFRALLERLAFPG